MNAETIITLFGGTTIVSLVSIFYRIWKERKGNTQKDLAGDLTLGELFREAARKEVVASLKETAELRATIRQLREENDCLRREMHEKNVSDQAC